MKCFEYNKFNKKACEKKTCRYWINCGKSNNCCINYVKEETYDSSKLTLQDIGDIFKVTRMRICQIEKTAIKKLKNKFSKSA